MSSSLPERFWAKIDTSGECWIWTARSFDFYLEGRNRKPHLLVWADLGREVPEGRVLRRQCDQPMCVKPEHRKLTPAGLQGWDQPGISPAFWEKVNKGGATPGHDPKLGPCWEWVAALDGKGYGVFNDHGTVTKAHLAHYRREVGPVPEGLFLDHKCFNRACVRLSHLRTLKPAENTQSREGAQRNSRTGVRGVVVVRSGRYRAEARAGKKFFSRTYDTLEEAGKAVAEWRRIHMPYSYMDQREEVAA